jgi:beta-glucosidase
MSRRLRFAASSVCAAILAAASCLAQTTQTTQAAPDSLDPAAEARVSALLAKMTLDEKIDLISGDTPFRTHPIPRLGIPFFQMADGPVGAHIPAPTIAYAAGIGLAASWDTALAVRVGEELGRDSRSRGAAILLGPGVNIYRAPMNGRNFEYFGEDPFLGGRIAVGYIDGVQHEGVSATVKHFLGNNSEYLRHDTDSVIDERTLREIYMPIFEAAVKQGHVGAIMDSYNITNGDHMTQNRSLNVAVAKQQWHFPGILISDWVSVYDTAAPFNAGLDLEMPYGTYFNRETILPLLKSGAIAESTLDDKVRRILREAVRFGWLDHPVMDLSIPRYNLRGRAVSQQGALEGTVLLQNTGNALPLKRDRLHTIAVIGPNAVQTVTTGGGSGEVVSFASTNLLTGISDAMGEHGDVLYSRGIYSTDQMARTTHFTVDAAGTQPGVKHETFSKMGLEGDLLASTTENAMVTAAGTRRQPEEQEINALTMRKSGNPYRQATGSARWTGYITPPQEGEYALFVQTDGKYRLLVDDAIVFDSSVVPKYILSQTTLRLTAAPHKVVLEQVAQQIASVSPMRVGVVPLDTIVDPDTLAIAARADVIILAVGFNSQSESEGGDRSFELPVGQDILIDKVAALGEKTGKNVIVAITSGGSVDVTPWKDKVQAILAAWYPGEQGGTALAKLLFGEENPSGHLPISWESKLADNPSYPYYYPQPGTDKVVYGEGIFVGYRGYEHSGVKPLYPFGYGLSYTSFSMSNFKAEPFGEGHMHVSFDVTNTGSRAGATVAQLYVGESKPTIERPLKELKGFERVALQPKETKHVTLDLDPRSFTFYDLNAKAWHANAGAYRLYLGDSSDHIEQQTTVTLGKDLTVSIEE